MDRYVRWKAEKEVEGQGMGCHVRMEEDEEYRLTWFDVGGQLLKIQ